MVWAFLHHLPCRKIPFLVAFVQHPQNEKDVHKTELILVDTRLRFLSSTSNHLTTRLCSHYNNKRLVQSLLQSVHVL